MPGLLRSRFNRSAAAKNYQVGERHLLAARVEVLLNSLQRAEYLGQNQGLVDLPALLRLQANTPTVRSAALIRTAEG